MTPYELVGYEPSDRSDYLGLLDGAWGHRRLSGEEFDWWFAGNPAGSLMSVARMEGKVVGVAAHSLLPMVLDGEHRLASFSVHATTHPSARGLGIFTALERRHEEEAEARGVAVVIGFASAPTAPIFLGPLGWTEVGRLRVWARPLRGIVRRGGNLREGRGPPGGDGDAAAAWPNHVVRDGRHLQWRYIDSPRGYRMLGSEDGYAVVGRRRQRGLNTAVLADFVASGSGARRLLRSAVSLARGCQVMIALPAPQQRRLFASLAFVPTTTSLHFMGKALAGRFDPDPAAWRFTLGDTDFF